MNFPSVDFFYKLITFVGIAVIVFAYTSFENSKSINESQNDKFLRQEANLNASLKSVARLKQYFADYDKYFDTRLEDDLKKLHPKLLNDYIRIMDSIAIKEEEYGFQQGKIYGNAITSASNKLETYKLEREIWKSSNERFYYDSAINISLMVIGGLLSIFGLKHWFRKDSFDNNLLIRENLDKPNFSTNCQSCGKGFNSVITYSNENNGIKNYHFCSGCYENGSFIEPDLTLQKIKERTKSYLHLHKKSEAQVKQILKKLNNLDRWKMNSY